jgi:hypothetical protein
MFLRVSSKKKYEKIFPESDPDPELDPDLLVRGRDPHQNVTDPQHW